MKIFKSLVIILALAVLTTGATAAVFSSRGELDNNTITTGILEIWTNGSKTAAGFTIPNMKPDKGYDKPFTVSNAGSGLGGPSTLPAKELAVTAKKTGGSLSLYNTLWVQLYVDTAGGLTSSDCARGPGEFSPGKGCEVLEGHMSKFDGGSSTDILGAINSKTELAVDEELYMIFDVLLPGWAPSSLMGQTVTFDLYVDGYIPHR